MENILTQKKILLTNDVDYQKRIKPSSVLDLFQEIAAEHALLLGCGFDEMRKNKAFWVLTRVKFEVLEIPRYKQEVEVVTWPREQGNVFFERDYMIFQGNTPCIKAESMWCVLNIDTQKILPAKSLDILKMDFKKDKAMENGIQKLQKGGEFLFSYPRVVQYSDLDFNDHVNNIRYADFMVDGLGDYFTHGLKSMQINYLKQVKLGSALRVEYYKREQGLYIAILCDEELMCEGEMIFQQS